MPVRSWSLRRLHTFLHSVGGHSLRARWATSLAASGVPTSRIQAIRRWNCCLRALHPPAPDGPAGSFSRSRYPRPPVRCFMTCSCAFSFLFIPFSSQNNIYIYTYINPPLFPHRVTGLLAYSRLGFLFIMYLARSYPDRLAPRKAVSRTFSYHWMFALFADFARPVNTATRMSL